MYSCDSELGKIYLESSPMRMKHGVVTIGYDALGYAEGMYMIEASLPSGNLHR